MKRIAAIFGIAALLLITAVITPAFGQAMSNAPATLPKVGWVEALKNWWETASQDQKDKVYSEVRQTHPELRQTPGFEAVFAIAGLLAVAYLVMRQKH